MHPFTDVYADSVAAWGEEKLIRAIRGWLGPASPEAPFGIGDDCAVLPASRSRQLITVDPVIYPRHFDDHVPPAAVGAKLLKRNLSDLAAMGGAPTAAVLALTLDGRVSRAWLKQFYRGLARTALAHRVPIVGGDIAESSSTVAASLTLLGVPTGKRILTRAGAKLGDAIFVTGVLGGSLSSGHHYKFEPRLAEGAWLARQPEVQAMMDVSDGLAKDLRAITPAGAAPALEAAALPLRSRCSIEQALTDGEDYELVFATAAGSNAAGFVRRWHDAFPRTRLSRIGVFVSAALPQSNALDLSRFNGYEHLRS